MADEPKRIYVDRDGNVIEEHEAVNGGRVLYGKAADDYLASHPSPEPESAAEPASEPAPDPETGDEPEPDAKEAASEPPANKARRKTEDK